MEELTCALNETCKFINIYHAFIRLNKYTLLCKYLRTNVQLSFWLKLLTDSDKYKSYPIISKVRFFNSTIINAFFTIYFSHQDKMHAREYEIFLIHCIYIKLNQVFSICALDTLVVVSLHRSRTIAYLN
jgi:hypothetical protein